MASDIAPGQWVNVKIVKRPRSAAKAKTMQRLFEQDRQVKTERKRLARSRPTRFDQRGGRPWGDRPPRLPIVQTEPGASYTIFGSVDVLRDLNSLDSLVEVTPAKG